MAASVVDILKGISSLPNISLRLKGDIFNMDILPASESEIPSMSLYA